MSRPLTIMLCAFEPSGDSLGAELMDALRASRPAVRLIGVGGSEMQARGLVPFFDPSELALMHFADIAGKLPTLLARMRQLTDFALRTRPDAIVLIDSSALTHRVAARIRKADPSLRLVKYVSPQVWASRPGRAAKMKALFDDVLCIMPFEPAFLAGYGVPATFVGHPAVSRTRRGLANADTARLNLPVGANVLCVLPGSRRSEVRAMVPVFRKIVAAIAPKVPNLVCVTPTVPNVDTLVRESMKDWPAPLTFVTGAAARYDAFAAADAALATSGTVTAELAVAGVPMVAGYELGALAMMVWRRLVTVNYITAINLVLDRLAIPEFPEAKGMEREMAAALLPLLNDPAAAAAQRAALAEGVQLLSGTGDPASTAATRVLAIAEK